MFMFCYSMFIMLLLCIIRIQYVGHVLVHTIHMYVHNNNNNNNNDHHNHDYSHPSVGQRSDWPHDQGGAPPKASAARRL